MLLFPVGNKTSKTEVTTMKLLCGKLEDSFATIFRQVAMFRFEQQAHARGVEVIWKPFNVR
mgnify:CR=1 FL=1